MSKPENITEITVLGQVMIGNKATEERGYTLLNDLADLLIPQATNGLTEMKGSFERSQAPAPAPVKPAPAKPAPAKPAPAKPAPAPAKPAPAPTALAPKVIMTPDDLNEALVIEFRRLGSREGIDKAMAEFGVTSVSALTQDQFQPMLDKVKALV